MSAFEAPASVNADTPKSFGVCMCSHPIYDHGRVNMDGNQVWVGCTQCGCETYRASDGSAWPNSYGGATLDDPADLDRNSDAWVDGQVVLAHEREPEIEGVA